MHDTFCGKENQVLKRNQKSSSHVKRQLDVLQNGKEEISAISFNSTAIKIVSRSKSQHTHYYEVNIITTGLKFWSV